MEEEKGNRVKIDGVWYVREDSIKMPEIKEAEVVWFDGAVYETEEICFEASLIKTNLGRYLEPTIEYTIKEGSRSEWKVNYIDNDSWLLSLLDGDPEALESAREIMTPTQIEHLKAFIYVIKEEGWFNKNEDYEQP